MAVRPYHAAAAVGMRAKHIHVEVARIARGLPCATIHITAVGVCFIYPLQNLFMQDALVSALRLGGTTLLFQPTPPRPIFPPNARVARGTRIGRGLVSPSAPVRRRRIMHVEKGDKRTYTCMQHGSVHVYSK